MHFYDSDLQSDNPDDFESDHETPQDQIKDVKFITKDELTRFNKQIYKCGRGIYKPAKFDEILIRAIKLEYDPEKKYKEMVDQVGKEKIHAVTLGFNNYPEWWELTVESMKRGEVSAVKIEHLKYDKNDMKVLDREEFWVFEMVEWTTCIDLNLDKQWYKYMLTRGIRQDKPEQVDEVQFRYVLRDGKSKSILAQGDYSQQAICLKPLVEGESDKSMPKSVWKIMRGMKKYEKSLCKFSFQAFQDMEKEVFKSKLEKQEFEEKQEQGQEIQQQGNKKEEEDEYKEKEDQAKKQQLLDQFSLIGNVDKDPILEEIGEGYLEAEIEIYDIVKLYDVFGDENALKRLIYQGENSSKPDKLALMKFEIEIYVEKEKIYSSKYKNLQEKIKSEQDYWENYLDDPKISKLLRHSLRAMKRKEISSIECKDNSLIKSGKDYEIIKERYGEVLPKNIFYILKVIEYTEGKNNFNMTIDEKIEHAKRKKIIGVRLIKEEKNYKKALKSFEAINAFFDFGTFYDEDKNAIYEHKLSGLLNSGLCYLQLKEWIKLIVVCDKALELQPDNAKAAYRKGQALKNQSKFIEAEGFIGKFMEEYGEKTEQDLKKQLQKLQGEIELLRSQFDKKEKKVFKKMFQ